MSDRCCQYFDDEPWKERVWQVVKQWEVGSFLSDAGLDEDREAQILDTLVAKSDQLTVEGAFDDRESVETVPIQEVVDIDALNFDRREFVGVWQEQKFAGPPLDDHLYDLQCPHDVLAGDDSTAEYCVFHLSPEKLDELGVDRTRESKQLREQVAKAESTVGKRFLGARLRQFGAAYAVYSSENRYPVDLRLSTVEKLEATDAKFTSGLLFSHARFACDAHFQSSIFHEINCDQAHFEGEVKFNHAEFSGEATFERAEFNREVTFNHAEFSSEASFSRAHFHQQVKYTQVEFRENAYFMHGTFGEKAIFPGTDFRADAYFYDSAFGKANFSGTTFDQAVTFETAVFHGRCSFDSSTVREEVQFAPETTSERVKFTDANISGGFIRQPVAETTNYLFDRAVLGEVDLEPKTDPDLFRHCLFENTTFDGFRFSDHLDALSSDWSLHRDDTDRSQQPVTLREPRRWVGALSEQNRQLYAAIESTYLRAKNGADRTGDSKIAQEFFLRERKYRRKKEANIAINGTDRETLDVLVRLRAVNRWATSWFYNLTCGYGERPLRTVLASGTLIGLFALLYMALETAVPGGESFMAYISFSVQTFVTLLIGPVPDTYPIHIRLLTGLEAFTGAFFIALFVFALTRSIKR